MSEKDVNSNHALGVEGLIDLGSNLAGSIAGTVVGLLVAGPPGAVAGAILGPGITSAIKKIGDEISTRVLGPREKIRIGATIVYAIKKVDENQKSGKTIRGDEFFKSNDNDRSSAEEITEGILLNAQREYQEKKIRFHGNLLANIAFHPEVTKEQANYMIRLAEKLSYRQLCIIALFGHSESHNLRDKSWRGAREDISSEKAALLQEIFELYSQGLLNGGGEALLGVGDIVPNKMRIQGITASLYNLMELWSISSKDIEDVVKLLQ